MRQLCAEQGGAGPAGRRALQAAGQAGLRPACAAPSRVPTETKAWGPETRGPLPAPLQFHFLFALLPRSAFEGSTREGRVCSARPSCSGHHLTRRPGPRPGLRGARAPPVQARKLASPGPAPGQVHPVPGLEAGAPGGVGQPVSQGHPRAGASSRSPARGRPAARPAAQEPPAWKNRSGQHGRRIPAPGRAGAPHKRRGGRPLAQERSRPATRAKGRRRPRRRSGRRVLRLAEPWAPVTAGHTARLDSGRGPVFATPATHAVPRAGTFSLHSALS